MTLVVARITDSGAMTIASDTAVTDYISRAIKPFDVLKSLILSNNLCVSFAGVDPPRATEWALLARDAVRSLDPLEVAKYLSRDHGNRDYLVASLQDGPSLVRVKDGRVETGLQVSWIGDYVAFSEYQARLDFARADLDAQALGQLQQLTDVIGDARIAGVGGAVIRVAVGDEGFRYAGDSTIYFDFETHGTVSPDRLKINTPPPNYSLIQCTPVRGGVPAVGLYFPQGHVGYLLAPEAGGRQKLTGAFNVAHFVELVAVTFGIELSCPSYPFE